jgi:hypothetical protein
MSECNIKIKLREIGSVGMHWTALEQRREQSRAPTNMARNIQVPCLSRTQLHGVSTKAYISKLDKYNHQMQEFCIMISSLKVRYN